MDILDREREAEYAMIRGGVERWEKHQAALVEKGRHWDSAPYNKLMEDMTAALMPAVKGLMKDARKKFIDHLKTGNRLGGWEIDLLTMNPAVVTYVTLRSILQDQHGVQRHVLAARIGEHLRLEAQYAAMVKEERGKAKEEGYYNRIEGLKRTVKEIGPRTVRKWIKKLDDLSKIEWDHKTKLHLGLALVETLHSIPEFIIFDLHAQTTKGRTRTIYDIQVREHILLKLRENGYRNALSMPWLQPMICHPRDWVGGKGGGYLEIERPLMIEGDNCAYPDPEDIPSEVQDAVNRAQKTPWAINGWVLEIANSAASFGAEEVLPVAPFRGLPERKTDAEWAAMSKSEKGKYQNRRRAIHDANNKLAGQRDTMTRVLALAEKYAEVDRFFFPYAIDWRGRLYPTSQDLHPQGNDFVRGLLRFADAKQVGPRGHLWLAHAIAAAFGQDKLSLTEQYTWVRNHEAQILDVGVDPFGKGWDFWVQAEEPWQFLAACAEWYGFASTGYDPLYRSALPVHVDGSCNGLQHLSAMGKDYDGAFATNLTSHHARQDIYQIVADKVAAKVREDLMTLEGHPEALAWAGKTTRKTVKRAVMTTPYGVTPMGIRTQLLDDGMLEGVEGDRMANANYMRDLILDAVDDTIVKGKQIMQWMQTAASALAEEGKPIHWHSPTGLKCTQEYRTPKECRLQTLMGRVYIEQRDNGGSIRKTKAHDSIAPNVVHSFDAAHLVRVVNEMQDADLALVHDSFGTHAGDVDRLRVTLKDKFVEMYGVDWLSVYAATWAWQLGYEVHGEEIFDDEGEWVYAPERGDFNVEDCRQSEWMFF